VAITSHPRWLLERWVPRFGVEGTLALCEANNRHARLGLRANRLRLDRKELQKRLEEAGLVGEPGRWSSHTVWVEADADFSDFPAYARGDCTVQDESETMVSQLLAPRAGERVLDLCAAPGGKTTHLAELMGDVGEIVAVEKMAPRARTMKKQVDRLGIKTVTIEVADGTTAALLPLGKGGPYDRALVDAPCSGLGVLARRADARWRKESSLFAEMAEVQGKLLRAAASVVRPGGTLVYSVCSFEPEETDEIVASFLAGHPEWSKEHAATILPKELVEEGGSMRILPHVHGVDGAFAVRLVRDKSRPAEGDA
jgi:16S rRNA (cytosine967-C5)-methyltransferase